MVIFIVRVFDSAIDSTFDSIIAPTLYPNGDYTGVVDIGTLGYMASSILLYVLSAIVFYFMVKQVIQKESQRQLKQQNLIYASIAHDLKTPMTSIQGFSKALLEGKIQPSELNEIYQIIYLKSKSMNELVESLFEYSKCNALDYKMNFERTNLSVLVRDLVALNYGDFESHDMILDIDISENPIYINADKKELNRAISNLINNTYKHNPNGTKVFVSLKEENKKAKLMIADNGKALNQQMNIFEPFVTENVSRSAGKGTGLGLAITKDIIDKHKAAITINKQIKDYTKAFEITFTMVE